MAGYQVAQSTMRTFIVNALKSWHKPAHPVPDADQLLLVQQAMESNSSEAVALATHRAIMQVLGDCLNEYETLNREDAFLLQQRYCDMRQVKELVKQQRETNKHITLENVKHRLRKALDQMARIAREKEALLRQDAIAQLRLELPELTYGSLVGAAQSLHLIQEQLLSTEARSWLMVVSGLGGIGKTSLVHAAITALLPQFRYRQLLWFYVSGGQLDNRAGDQLPLHPDALSKLLLKRLDPAFPGGRDQAARTKRLRDLFGQEPTLLVIDNLEDRDETEAIVEWLTQLADPLQVVVTARHVPSVRPAITSHHLGELSQAATSALIRQHAALVGCDLLVSGNDDLLESIYAAVGGNPLAVKIVVGISADLELEWVLRDLVAAQHGDIHAMYQRIFEQAWASLSADAQLVLKIMPLATERGMSLALLQHNSELEFGRLAAAIKQLRRRSLLDVNGTTVERSYTIHQLTRAFIGSSVIKWHGDMPGG